MLSLINSGTFPTEWNIGVIKPIYKKKGDIRFPSNYRGITETSCPGKQFTSILQSRLKKFIEQHNVLNPEQFGFKANARATNSLFILPQLFHNFTKQHKKLHVDFIADLEKAFLTQSGLIYKVQLKYTNMELRANSQPEVITESMYSSIKSCVKIDKNTTTDLFSCGIVSSFSKPLISSLLANLKRAPGHNHENTIVQHGQCPLKPKNL